MPTVYTIEFIISITTLFLGYCISVTLANTFRAWMAQKMGDDTPTMLGYLNLNPLVHIDPIGLIFLLLTDFGWGTYAPINFNHIDYPWHRLRTMVAAFANTFAYSVTAVITMTTLLLFDKNILILPDQNSSLAIMTHCYPTASSSALIVCLIGMSMVRLAIGLGALSFVINTVDVFLYFFTNHSRQTLLQFDSEQPFKSIALIIVFIWVFAFILDILRSLLFYTVYVSSISIIHILGFI